MSNIMELADNYARETHPRLITEARAALQAEVERVEALQYRGAPCHTHCEATAFTIEARAMSAEIKALREKLAAVEKDAARYRWLRDKAFNTFICEYMQCFPRHGLDAAIDAEMEPTK